MVNWTRAKLKHCYSERKKNKVRNVILDKLRNEFSSNTFKKKENTEKMLDEVLVKKLKKLCVYHTILTHCFNTPAESDQSGNQIRKSPLWWIAFGFFTSSTILYNLGHFGESIKSSVVHRELFGFQLSP